MGFFRKRWRWAYRDGRWGVVNQTNGGINGRLSKMEIIIEVLAKELGMDLDAILEELNECRTHDEARDRIAKGGMARFFKKG